VRPPLFILSPPVIRRHSSVREVLSLGIAIAGCRRAAGGWWVVTERFAAPPRVRDAGGLVGIIRVVGRSPSALDGADRVADAGRGGHRPGSEA